MFYGALGPSSNTYPLTPSELEAFGWLDDDTTPLVMAVRSPDGRRYIPTKQTSSTGEVIYGFIVTSEPPPDVPVAIWERELSQAGLHN